MDQVKEDGSNKKVTIGLYEYETKEMLGQGAYGIVYKGRKSFDGGEVALKRVPSDLLKYAEVDTPCKARCPYVVNCLDVITVESEDATYVVLELCDSDLSQFLKSYGHLNNENLDLLAKCLAEGYLILRKNCIVHRDIKPQNILLKFDRSSPAGDQPKITVAKFSDFGCSRNDSECDLNNLAGTFFYMAPEVGANIIESHRYTFEVDMWSIGTVLYECIEGRCPFSEQQLCKLFLRATDNNFFGYDPPVPRISSTKYQKIVKSLLSLDPGKRLTPGEFYDAVFDRVSAASTNDRTKKNQFSCKTLFSRIFRLKVNK